MFWMCHSWRSQRPQCINNQKVLSNHNRQIRRLSNSYKLQNWWFACCRVKVRSTKMRSDGSNKYDQIENVKRFWGHLIVNRQKRKGSDAKCRHFYGVKDQRDGIASKNFEWMNHCLESEHRWSENIAFWKRRCRNSWILCTWVS